MNLINFLHMCNKNINLKKYKDISLMKDLLLKYNTNDYLKYSNLKDNTYTKQLLLQNKILEIYLLSWSPKSYTQIHKHALNGCYMKMLDGSLTEYKYDKQIKLAKKKTHKKNDVSYINNSMHLHKIKNNTDKPAFTLHIYSPPKII